MRTVLKRLGAAARRILGVRLPPPHRISLRLGARLLRLPLKGGVILCSLDKDRDHSPLEGESARGRSPQSSRWGANTPPRE